jgi:hypothetical protein
MFITKLAEPPLVIAAEIKTRILDVAKDAPTELADRLKELAGSDATQPKNEWVFPAIALVTLTIIFYMMSRRKPTVAA